MKKFIPEIIITASVVLAILISALSLQARATSRENNPEKFIEVKNINSKVIKVGLGYEAVSAVNTSKELVVIDTGISNSLTGKYRKIIAAEFGRKDFAYIVNKYSHSDHTGGNRFFKDAVVIAHENCKNEMQEGIINPAEIKAKLNKLV